MCIWCTKIGIVLVLNVYLLQNSFSYDEKKKASIFSFLCGSFESISDRNFQEGKLLNYVEIFMHENAIFELH
jgi:hypothetical protein